MRSTNDVDTLLRFAKWSAASVVFVFGFFGFAVAWIRGMADDAEDEDGPEQNYDIHEVLGQGAFGKVVRATVKHEIRDMDVQTAKEKSRAGQATHHDEQDFAIKYLHIENAKTATEGIMEATRLVRCSHPNIVNLREQFFRNRWGEMSLVQRLTSSPFQLCLVMERCDGDVLQLIQSWAGGYKDGAQPWGPDPPVDEKLRIVAQITSAVACIHSASPALIHRDLKPENVFIAHLAHPHTGKDHLHVKIGDLGLVARQEDDAATKGFAGTPGYIAPELYQYWDSEADDYDERCDVWSIGMIFVDLLLPEPFTSCDGGSAAFQARDNTHRHTRTNTHIAHGAQHLLWGGRERSVSYSHVGVRACVRACRCCWSPKMSMQLTRWTRATHPKLGCG